MLRDIREDVKTGQRRLAFHTTSFHTLYTSAVVGLPWSHLQQCCLSAEATEILLAFVEAV